MSPVVERALDLDSHEMVPFDMRPEVFGPTEYHEAALEFTFRARNPNHPNNLSLPITADDTPIDHDSVWNVKGPAAPSAIDLLRRPEVLDEMGIQRQLVYPTFALSALRMWMDPHAAETLGFEAGKYDCRRLAIGGVDAHNRWAARMTKATNDRVRPVGVVLTDSVDSMVRQTEQMLADGIQGLMIPASVPPGGTSPADEALDPFWRLAADANVPVTIHLGTEPGFLSSAQWSANVDVFHPSAKSTVEFVIEPLSATTIHFAAENFLTAMVLGGVFERHPDLRFGVIEVAASWVGPLAERLDLWAASQFPERFRGVLTMPPSEYIARNVRVTPFHFEPVALYFERYPNLASVYCFSTDYPHFEGGKESKRVFAEALSDASPTVRDQFFFTNATWLLPA